MTVAELIEYLRQAPLNKRNIPVVFTDSYCGYVDSGKNIGFVSLGTEEVKLIQEPDFDKLNDACKELFKPQKEKLRIYRVLVKGDGCDLHVAAANEEQAKKKALDEVAKNMSDYISISVADVRRAD